MTDIAVLEQQEREAFHEYKAASDRWSAARKAVADAKLVSTGLVGHLVSFSSRRGYGTNRKTVECKFVVDSLAYGRRPAGRVLRKDGTLGTQRKDANPEDLTDLGIYVPAA